MDEQTTDGPNQKEAGNASGESPDKAEKFMLEKAEGILRPSLGPNPPADPFLNLQPTALDAVHPTADGPPETEAAPVNQATEVPVDQKSSTSD